MFKSLRIRKISILANIVLLLAIMPIWTSAEKVESVEQFQTFNLSIPTSDIVPYPNNPTWISHQSSPTIFMYARQYAEVTIKHNDEIVGSGRGKGLTELLPITLNRSFADGVYALKAVIYNTDNHPVEYDLPLLIIDSNKPFDIGDVVLLAQSLPDTQWDFNGDGNTEPISADIFHLLNMIEPSYTSTSYDYSRVSINNHHDRTSTVTLFLFDQWGNPDDQLTSSDLKITYTPFVEGDEVEIPIDASHFIKKADGWYEFIIAHDDLLNVNANLLIRGQHFDTIYIYNAMPIIHHVEATPGGTISIPYDLNVDLGGTVKNIPIERWTVSEVVYDNPGQMPSFDISSTATYILEGENEDYDFEIKYIVVVTDPEEYRIIVTWDEKPSDLDSHLQGYLDGNPFRIFYDNSSSNNAELEWDVMDGYGPELLRIKHTGTYRFGLHRFSSYDDLSVSNATVDVYKGNILLQTYELKDADHTVVEGTFWTVFQMIDGELYEPGISRVINGQIFTIYLMESSINTAIAMIDQLTESATEEQISAARAAVVTALNNRARIEDIVNIDKLIQLEVNLFP